MKNKTNSSLFEQHGITYCEINGVFIPNLELPEQKEIGQFGLQHEIWLKTHHHLRHSLLLGSGELNEYLYQVDKEANEMYESLITDYAKAEGVNEYLKDTDQMKWVQMMRSISDRAREFVEHEIIFQ